MASKDKTVLVVDDEDSLRELAAKLIAKRGYTVLTAGSGAEALAVLQSGTRVDLIVLDVMMPDLDGLATLERIRALGIENLFVILLTSRSDDAEVLGGYKSGADYYITKPLKPAELLNIVDYLIGGLPPEERARLEAAL